MRTRRSEGNSGTRSERMGGRGGDVDGLCEWSAAVLASSNEQVEANLGFRCLSSSNAPRPLSPALPTFVHTYTTLSYLPLLRADGSASGQPRMDRFVVVLFAPSYKRNKLTRRLARSYRL
jgi:hypothetical protein